MNFNELSELSNKFNKLIFPSIIHISTMRVLSSLLKGKSQTSDFDGFNCLLQKLNIPVGKPGWHEQFEFQKGEEDVIILRIDDGFSNGSEYLDYIFTGGLFAMTSCYLDDDLEEQTDSLISYFDDNELYKIDYNENGNLRHEVLFENLISPDDKRELVSIFVPIKEL